MAGLQQWVKLNLCGLHHTFVLLCSSYRQSLRLLAYDSGTLDGRRWAHPDHDTAVNHAHTVCAPMWWLSPQSMNDCAHAAGHVRRAPG